MPELVVKIGAHAATVADTSEKELSSKPKKRTKPDWLDKFPTTHYRLGRDDIWVIGRLPGPVDAAQRRSRRNGQAG